MTINDGLKKTFGFTKTPMNPGDDGVAFADFVGFVIGDSPEAAKIRQEFNAQYTQSTKSLQYAADFMDWLIVTHWGEATK